MHSHLNARKLGVAALLVITVLAAATYGGSSSSQASTTSSTASSGGSKAAIAAAQTALAPYVGHPNAFPVTQKLVKKPPTSTTIAYLECGAPTCAMFAKDLKASTAALGAKLDVISAGLFSSTVQSAAEAALAEHAKPPRCEPRAVNEKLCAAARGRPIHLTHGDAFLPDRARPGSRWWRAARRRDGTR